MAPVYIGLVHYPIYNKHMEVVMTALTNYDLHDIARTAKTYGVRTYFIIHPIESQREMALRIMTHWKTGGGVHYNPNRKEAFEETALVPSLEDAVRQIEKDCGEKPIIVTTDALSTRTRFPIPLCGRKSMKRKNLFSFCLGQASA